MAMMIGAPGRHALDKAVRVFQKMFLTTGFILVAVGVFEGVVFSSVFGKGFFPTLAQIVGLPVGGLAIWWLCQNQNRRIDQFERERARWRKGAAGELSIVETLKNLPDTYLVLNGLKTQSGDLDHVVVGPTGLFFVETKNWRGVVAADGSGELLNNGRPLGRPAVRSFLARCMMVVEQLEALAQEERINFRAAMVFPWSRVEAPFGQTGRVHCMTDERLCGYIENEAFSSNLSKEQVRTLARALEGIARMEPAFAESAASEAADGATGGGAVMPARSAG
jgi:hypothetical protein